MPLKRLSIYNARNIRQLSLEFHSSYNLLYGSNGVGKTTILESIYFLLRARTFRTNKLKSFISNQSDECIIFSNFFKNDNSPDFNLGIKRSITDTSLPIIHLNNKKVSSISTLTKYVILGLITPDSFTLIDSGPSVRRKYLDWGVFHVEHSFLKLWKDYKRVLENRNHLLKKYSTSQQQQTTNNVKNLNNIKNEISAWDKELITLNNKISDYRKNQFKNIILVIKEILKQFSKSLAEDLSIDYYRGWNKDIDYGDFLQQKLRDDLKLGYTGYGTHRSDIRLLIKGKSAKDILSRGQKKIVVISMILAQFVFINRYVKQGYHSDQLLFRHQILLLDDLDSELDDNNLQILFNYLSQFKNIQYFITTTNIDHFNFLENDKCEMFHVEHI